MKLLCILKIGEITDYDKIDVCRMTKLSFIFYIHRFYDHVFNPLKVLSSSRKLCSTCTAFPHLSNSISIEAVINSWHETSYISHIDQHTFLSSAGLSYITYLVLKTWSSW